MPMMFLPAPAGITTNYVISDVESIERNFDTNILSKDYLISLINLSGECFTIGGRRSDASKEYNWFNIPKTCKNCSSDYNTCADQGRYSGILSVDCTSQPFQLFVGYMIDRSTVRGAEFDIAPNCSYAGAIIGIA